MTEAATAFDEETLNALEVTESHRPSLRKLTYDVESMRDWLRGGFEDRRDVLKWCQCLTIRTLGELPQRFYRELARQFRGGFEGSERVLLSALLTEEVRHRDDIDQDAAEVVRADIEAHLIAPAQHRAFRTLRKNAGEYFDAETARKSRHDPRQQEYVAMRPTIDELERDQQRALVRLLDGLEGAPALVDWFDDVNLATHGEIPEAFITKCYRERSTRSLLAGTEPHHERGRELFAATYLIPYYNLGVRDLVDRVKESPDADREPQEAKLV